MHAVVAGEGGEYRGEGQLWPDIFDAGICCRSQGMCAVAEGEDVLQSSAQGPFFLNYYAVLVLLLKIISELCCSSKIN